MHTKNQLTVFLLCVAVGVVGGILYELFGLFRLPVRCVKRKGEKGKKRVCNTLEAAIDVCFFIAFALLCIVCAYVFGFPGFRVYMWLGYALGLVGYLKSLHRILAFLEKVCYNKVIQVVKKRKKTEKALQKEVER